MGRMLKTCFLISILSLPVFSQQHLNTKVATWEAKFEFDNELYPSYVLTVSGLRMAELPSEYIGDPTGIAEVWIVSSVPNAKVHVEIKVEGWANLSELDAVLPVAGKRYRLAPYLRYDFRLLAKTNQSYPAQVEYSVKVNDIDLGGEMLPIRIRSVNDVPFYTDKGIDGEPGDYKFLFAGYVNESHPSIQTLLQEALKGKAVDSFMGYQTNPVGVSRQVLAIWNALQRRHVRYSNIATPSASSPSGTVYSQAVRFVDETIDSLQANCVDGSVLFASALYKIGIHPILVLKPEHMFVGYWLDKGHSSYEFLETTIVGSGRQPRSLSESATQFVEAVQYANKVFNEEVQPAINQNKIGYLMIDIAEARKVGINAIPRPGK